MAHEKVVIVGAGGIAGAWLPRIVEEKLHVAGIVDLNIERAYQRAREYKLEGVECSCSLREMLALVRPDFVLDLTVPEAHCHVTTTALLAGYPVCGEKPMAATMAQARKMVAISARTGTMYMVSQSRRWEARHASVQKTIAAGRIGRLTTVNCDFYIGAHFGGFRDEMPSPLILDMAIHHFDLARYMSGQDPVAVYAREFNPAGSWYRGDAAASCIFEMTNGVIFTYRGSWCAEGCHTSWNGDWRLIGDKGTLLLEKDQAPAGEVVSGDSGFHRPKKPLKPVAAKVARTAMHGGLCEMLAYLRKGTVPQTQCQDNIKSLAMVFAAIESSKKGKRVPVRAM